MIELFTVGSPISILSKTSFVSGIQKVTVENNKMLKENLATRNVEFKGVCINEQDVESEFRKSDYLSSDVLINDEKVPLEAVDLLFISDCTSQVPIMEIINQREKRKLPVVSIIYDILPITHPHLFPSEQSNLIFRINLQKQLAVSDVVICISETVKQAVLSLRWKFEGEIIVSHLGAPPIQNKVPRFEMPHTLICVGTIEPRKGHDDLIDAFDILKETFPDLVLIVAGRLGWKSDAIADRILNHPEYKKRLKWFNAPNEDELETLYSLSSVAIAPSIAEGYGLNVDEALSRSVKVLARDLQVFRERASKNVYYFSGGGQELALEVTRLFDLEFEKEKIREFSDFSQDITDIIMGYIPTNKESHK
jgi:glycosyltransferase involved in cell wall biosynthesis